MGGEGGEEEERRHSAMVWGWLKLGLACVGVVGGIWGAGVLRGGGGWWWRGVGRWIWWFTVGVGWALKLNQLAPGAGGPFTSRQGEVSTARGLRRGAEGAVLGARASWPGQIDGWVGGEGGGQRVTTSGASSVEER